MVLRPRTPSNSPAIAASLKAMPISALSTIAASSRARSRGIVVTATPPAFKTPNQQAASIGVLKPRSSTRPPLTRPKSLTSTSAMRLRLVDQLGVAPGDAGALQRKVRAEAAFDRAVEDFDGCVDFQGIAGAQRRDVELRPEFGRRQRLDGRTGLRRWWVREVGSCFAKASRKPPPASCDPSPASGRRVTSLSPGARLACHDGGGRAVLSPAEAGRTSCCFASSRAR